MIFMNKKGDAPTGFLIIVALLLSLATLYAFASFDSNVSSYSENLSKVQSEIDFSYKYVLKSSELAAQGSIALGGNDVKEKFIKLAAEKDFRLDGTGNFFGKVRNGDFKFDEKESGWILEFNGVFVQSSFGANSIKRNLDFSMEFDSNGRLVKLHKVYK